MHVLFVCTGNVCRSVIAERLTRAFADRHGLYDLTTESAGVRALVGFGMEPLAAQTITGLGGDPDNFKARRFKPEMAQRADLVLAMTEQIRDEIVRQTPDAARYCFTLLEAFRIAKVSGARTIADMDQARNDLALVGRENISDPSSLSAQKYIETGDAIAEALLPLLFALHLHQGRSTDERGRPQLVVIDGGKSTRPASAPQPAVWYDSGRIGRHA